MLSFLARTMIGLMAELSITSLPTPCEKRAHHILECFPVEFCSRAVLSYALNKIGAGGVQGESSCRRLAGM